jgi:hypothetical protein
MKPNSFCEHSFIVLSKKKSEKSEHATQLICSKCLVIVNTAELPTHVTENAAQKSEA